MKQYGNQKRTSMRFLPIFSRKDIRQKTQSSQTLLPTLWQEVEGIDLHQTMPIFCAFKTAKRRTYLENVYRIGFGNNKMEVINFKAVHENNNIALVKTCDMFRAENAKLKERINEMVESRREYLDV